MATVISKIGIKDSTGSTYDTREIGAKGQNVEIGIDAAGKVIPDVDTTIPTSTKTLTTVLKEQGEADSTLENTKAPNNHRWAEGDATDYGKADSTHYGHIRPGTGLYVDSDSASSTYGSTNVNFADNKEVAENKAVQANDSRLNDDRKNPEAVTFATSGGDTAGSYDGSAAKTVDYSTVGAAPAGHTSIKADASTLGHVKVGTGLSASSGILSVSYGTAAGTACQGNDSRLSNTRTPKSHAASTASSYGAGTGSQYGHVMLTDTYSVTSPSASTNGAATSIAASAYALQQAYSTLNSKINQNEYKDITSDYTSGVFSANLDKYNPGNYIKRTYNDATYVMVLADYDYFYAPYGLWNALLTKHHWVALVLGFTSGQMNSSDTTSGGFRGSAMYTWLQSDCLTVIKNIAANHYLTNQRLISNGTYNGYGNQGHGFGWEWTEMAACLMSEIQLFGSKCWSDIGWSCGEANRQLDLFRNDSYMNVLGRDFGQGGQKIYECHCWLRDISAGSPGTAFCGASYDGVAGYWGASSSFGRYPIINLY
jgi:hypothetical protein